MRHLRKQTNKKPPLVHLVDSGSKQASKGAYGQQHNDGSEKPGTKRFLTTPSRTGGLLNLIADINEEEKGPFDQIVIANRDGGSSELWVPVPGASPLQSPSE